MISTRGRYALRVMIDLAEQGGQGPVPLHAIAERQGMSKKYLEILMRDLVEGGLVRGASGRGGGYRLCRPAEEYTVGEIIERMEGTMASVACLADGAEKCPRSNCCKTLPMWNELDRIVHDYLNSKKLSEFA